MTDHPPLRQLFVLSDLHLTPGGEHRLFAAHERLVGLLGFIAAQPGPSCLVLNGDVFDFLQIPGYDALSLPLAPQRMATILDALAAEPKPRNVVAALQRVSDAGHLVCCLPGNHDAELNLFTVQEVLRKRIGSSLQLAPAAGEWKLEVAGCAVVGRHGHYADAFNAISGATMMQAQARGDDRVELPPGSRLVRDVINPYRRARDAGGARRFPFVDLLPSDEAVVLALLLIDPKLAWSRLQDALGIFRQAFTRKILSAFGGGGARLARNDLESAAPLPTDSVAAWSDSITGAIATAAKNEPDLAADSFGRELDAYLAGLSAGASLEFAGDGFESAARLAGGGMIQRVLWRALSASLEKARDAFRPDLPDALARDAINGWGRGQVAICGHTHAAKSIAGEDGGTYLNTGTWLELVAPPQHADAGAVQSWLAQLQGNKIARWQGAPTAVVDADGARLMSWDGSELRPWDCVLPEI